MVVMYFFFSQKVSRLAALWDNRFLRPFPFRPVLHSVGGKASPAWSRGCAVRSPFQSYSAGTCYVTAVAVNSGPAVFMLPFLTLYFPCCYIVFKYTF